MSPGVPVPGARAVLLVALAAVSGAALADEPIPFVWGESGTGPGRFAYPADVAVGALGTIYVADAGNDRIQRFDEDGVYLGEWGAAGSDPGRLAGPVGVAVGPARDVFVADRGNHRVQRFTEDGAFVLSMGEAGSGPGRFRSLRGIAVRGDRVFVTDDVLAKVTVFTASGDLVREIGSPGGTPSPTGIAVGSRGSIWVTDPYGHHVHELSMTGEPRSVIGHDVALFEPWSVAADARGTLYLTNADAYSFGDPLLYALSPGGEVLRGWGPCNSDPVVGICGALGIAVSRQRYVYVTTRDDRIYRYDLRDVFDTPERRPAGAPDGIPVADLVTFPFTAGATISFTVERAARLPIVVHDVAGRVVRTFGVSTYAAGTHRIRWDGRDDRGAQAAAGVYFVRFGERPGAVVRKIVRAGTR